MLTHLYYILIYLLAFLPFSLQKEVHKTITVLTPPPKQLSLIVCKTFIDCSFIGPGDAIKKKHEEIKIIK